MKKMICGLGALVVILCGVNGFAGAINEDGKDKYTEVSVQDIKVSPEKYSSKRVSLETVYFRILTNYPKYIESDYSYKKYCCIAVDPQVLPVVVPKKDFEDLLKELKPKDKIKIMGKIKKLKMPVNSKKWRNFRSLPRFCLLVEKIELIDAKPKTDADAAAEEEKKDK